VLCGTLELIPFIGNLTGTALTALVTMAQDGSEKVLGVLIVYVIVQGLQSYILEPLIVGKQVKVHPMFTILVIVLGELVWGIAGMFMAIPLLGIAKVIFDHVPALNPYGYLVGEEENEGDPGMMQQWKLMVRRMLGKEGG
jgi:predicted PurR-regulated permease PerM